MLLSETWPLYVVDSHPLVNSRNIYNFELVHDESQWCRLPVVVNSTKTLELIPIFLNFFRSLYAPVSNHVTPALTPAKLPL
jgi:hypothetical protein